MAIGRNRSTRLNSINQSIAFKKICGECEMITKTWAAFFSARGRFVKAVFRRVRERARGDENSVRRLAQIVFIEKRLPKGLGVPLQRFLRSRWKTNLHMMEIEITTLCNLRCYNCDRSCQQAASDERMTIDQVRRFVDESIKLGWKWNWIKVMGGEPTLHPDLLPILEELERYKKAYNGCVVEIITNGLANSTRETLKKVPGWVRISNTGKTSRVQDFDAYNVAPIHSQGFDSQRAMKACWITNSYGVGFTRYGFYQCGAGASIDRVFGFGIGIRRLEDLKAGHLAKQRPALCALCGHLCPIRTREEKTSASWQRAYGRYGAARPQLALY
jgi:hypothetical protein